jgi:3-dehydroquinate synthase
MESLGLRLWDDALDQRNAAGRRAILEGLDEFREHLGGELTVTIPDRIGHAIEIHEMREALVTRSLEILRRREGAR